MSDTDLDGIENSADNCSLVSNHSQLDDDNDGVGNVCDAYPHDPDNERPGSPKLPVVPTPEEVLIPLTGGGGTMFWEGENAGLSIVSGDGAGIGVTVLETTPGAAFEVYGIQMTDVGAALHLDIPETAGTPPTVIVSFATLDEHTVFVALPDGSHYAVPTVCMPATGGGFVCTASYTPNGTADSWHPVLCLHD